MKKYIFILYVCIFGLFSMTGCGNSAANTSAAEQSADTLAAEPADSEGLSIVTTIFPEYDWVREILGDNPSNAEITLLLDSGVDLHNYQPTTEDILKIANCDLFIYVGGESDEWVEDALKEATNQNMVVINLLDSLGDKVKEEEIVEGMEADEHEEEEGPEYDEHVWLSLNNANVLVDVIRDAIISIDSANSPVYTDNAKAYTDKLSALNEEYVKVTDEASVKTVLFGDRFPFRYLVDDYGLSYYAAFAGCSAETEASFETVVFLANKVDELSLPSIMTIDGSDKKIAETIKENTSSKDQEILTIDSMQSTTAEDISKGATYLSIMEGNLEVLKQALK